MQRIICSMKVVLFGSQLIQLGTMKKEDIATHSDLVVFYTIFYIRQWTQSPLLVDSAINDLTLLKELKKINHQPFERFKKAMSEKLECHLWFLSEELVFTCLFSDLLTDSQKNKCAQALRSHKPSEQLGKLVTPTAGSSTGIQDLFGPRSYLLPRLLEVPADFLELPAASWSGNDSYNKLKALIGNLPAVNDAAERAVLLGKCFHNKLTSNPQQTSALYVTVPETRRDLNKRRKLDVMK